jgi:hypothetical protein
VTVEVTDVAGTESTVTGLTPGAHYTFSVTAENAVSSQDSNINARTVNMTATTQEGVGAVVSEFEVSGEGVLSWSPPVPPNGCILYYNVLITRADTGELVRNIGQLNSTTIDLTSIGEIGTDYNVTVRVGLCISFLVYSSLLQMLLRMSSL